MLKVDAVPRTAELPQFAIEANCNVINLVDWLRKQSTMQRNPKYAQALRQIRIQAVRTNTYICLAWFPMDSLGDLDPPVGAA